MPTLKQQGFRYGWTGTKWDWVHPAMLNDRFIDCTNMNDETFEKLVKIIDSKDKERQS